MQSLLFARWQDSLRWRPPKARGSSWDGPPAASRQDDGRYDDRYGDRYEQDDPRRYDDRQTHDVKAALNSRRQVVAGDYDVLRIGTPGYAEQLARGRPWDPSGMSDDIDDRPWLRQETAGVDLNSLEY